LDDQIEKSETGGSCSTYGGEEKCAQRFGGGKGKIYFEDAGIDRTIILKWVFSKWDVGSWTGSIWLRIGTGSGHLETW
jgi:hypothetical protein